MHRSLAQPARQDGWSEAPSQAISLGRTAPPQQPSNQLTWSEAGSLQDRIPGRPQSQAIAARPAFLAFRPQLLVVCMSVAMMICVVAVTC
jgi:hypothetical protein